MLVLKLHWYLSNFYQETIKSSIAFSTTEGSTSKHEFFIYHHFTIINPVIFFLSISHLIHHLLAAYSLGASKEKLQEIFDDHAKDQRPMPPSNGEITPANFKEHLGVRKSYSSFLTFFKSEIEKNGAIDTVRRWVWSGDMLARTIGGAFHPLIHVGYGLEFDIPGIVAEGLAMGACTEASLLKIIPKLPDVQLASLVPVQAQSYAENASASARGYVTQLVDSLSSQITTHLGMADKVTTPSAVDRGVSQEDSNIPSYLKGNTLFPIFQKVRKDPAFDNLVDAKSTHKFDSLSSNDAALERINHYVNQWTLHENTKDIQAKFKELYTIIGLAIGSTGIRKEHPDVLRLDFFIMHALTSSEFLHQYISRVAPSESVSLLKGHLASTLYYYIIAGRPDFNFEGLINYKSPIHDPSSNNNWLKVFDKSLSCTEPHVIKVVRACAVAQVIYGPNEDPNLNAIWLRVAQMAIDKNGDWDFAGVGFDQTWQ